MHDGPEPDDHGWQRRHQPPTNEVPVLVPLRVAIVRTPDVAVSLVGVETYSTGVLLELRMVVRPGAGTDLMALHHGAQFERTAERFGVAMADGTRTSTLLDWRGTDGVDEPVLDTRGGGGGSMDRAMTYWLAPVPPPGPMTLVYACPAVGVDEVQLSVDATALAEAAAQIEQLWPWEPEPPHDPTPPTPPDLPEDSWFAADVRRWTTG